MAQKVHSRDEWIARAQAILPAGGLGNFDPGFFIRNGAGSRVSGPKTGASTSIC